MQSIALYNFRGTIQVDSQCGIFFNEFITDAVKVFLGVIQMFGHNLARQRERIVSCIEDFAALQNEVFTCNFFLARILDFCYIIR